MQRLSLVWGDSGQTSGVIAGPFQGIGVCVSVNVIEQGKVETFAVGSMDASTGVLTELPIDPLAMKTGGVAICAHGCDDPCAGKRCRMVVGKSFVFVGGGQTVVFGVSKCGPMWSKCVVLTCLLHVSHCLPVAEDHNDCNTCKSDSSCGWAFNKGCFDLASGITGVSNKGKNIFFFETHPPHTRTPFNIQFLCLTTRLPFLSFFPRSLRGSKHTRTARRSKWPNRLWSRGHV